jgi:gliding motility associated protien GldN
MKKLSFLFLVLSLVSTIGFAQENSGFNPNSVRPIHNSDIMYKKSVKRALDLREKQNQSLFSVNHEITRIIINAVKEGKLKAYATDSLDAGKSLTKEEFLAKMKMGGGADGIDTTGMSPEDLANLFGNQYYEPRQLFQMEMTEDVIFDKQRSRLYYDIQAVTMKVPAEFDARGVEAALGSFKYKDLYELFKKDPNAIWYNGENDQAHLNLADAFELRLFSAYIIYVSNPKNAMVVDIYNQYPKEGIMASSWMANQIMEYEHNLWEF